MGGAGSGGGTMETTEEKKKKNISCNTGLGVMNSFSFFLSGKLFICPSILNDSFAG